MQTVLERLNGARVWRFKVQASDRLTQRLERSRTVVARSSLKNLKCLNFGPQISIQMEFVNLDQ